MTFLIITADERPHEPDHIPESRTPQHFPEKQAVEDVL